MGENALAMADSDNKRARKTSHLEAHKWRPGQSGNPAGRPAGIPTEMHRLRELARTVIPVAVERLKELCQSKDEALALQAVQFAYLYTFGKPQEGRDLAHLEAIRARMTELVAVPVSMSPEEAAPSTAALSEPEPVVVAQELPLPPVLTAPVPPEAPDVESPPAPVSAPTGLRCIFRSRDGQCADMALPGKQWCDPHHAKLFSLVQP